MTRRPHRVAVFSTGAIASHAIRHVLARPALELAAVWTHDPAKAGRDVADVVDLEGAGHTGVTLVSSVAEVVAAVPDCAIYASSSPKLDAAYVPHYVELLSAGVDVLTVSTPGLVFPEGFEPGIRAQLEEAALEGGATLYASGLEPGFAGDQLVALLSTLSGHVDSVRVQEIFRYDSYPNEFLMRDVFGFGMPLDQTPLMQLEGSQQLAWAPPVRYVAAVLGVELEEIRETFERVATPRDLEVAMGRIEAGTAGAVRMETIGVVDGREAIVIEHVNRMAADLAPEWPDARRDGTYRVIVEGEPFMTCELTFGRLEADSSLDGMVATAMRLVNAIPEVRAAPPGLVSSLDLPLTTCAPTARPRR